MNCKYCFKKFDTRHYLNKHVKNRHTEVYKEEKPFKFRFFKKIIIYISM